MKRKLSAKILLLALLISISALCFAACDGVLTEVTHNIDGEFSQISVTTDTADVIFVKHDGAPYVKCAKQKDFTLTVTVEDGLLAIRLIDTRAWYQKIFTFGAGGKVRVYLPQSAWDHVHVQTATGDVEITDVTANKITVTTSTGDIDGAALKANEVILTASTGDIDVESILSVNLSVTTSTGDVDLIGALSETLTVTTNTGEVDLERVVASADLKIETDTGDVDLQSSSGFKVTVITDTGEVSFSRLDGTEIFIETDTGDVKGTLLTDKIIFAQTDTGRVDVPKLTTGGRCEITTDTGDIRISIEG